MRVFALVAAVLTGIVGAYVLGTNLLGAAVLSGLLWVVYWLTGRGARRDEGKK